MKFMLPTLQARKLCPETRGNEGSASPYSSPELEKEPPSELTALQGHGIWDES